VFLNGDIAEKAAEPLQVVLLPMRVHARQQVTQAVGRIIEGWNLVVGKGGIVYAEFKKQYDGIVD
jgi:hypothetical protein